MEADCSVFRHRARFLRDVSQHECLSAHRDSTGATIAVVHQFQCFKHALKSLDAEESFYSGTRRHSKHVCDRSGLPDRICAQLDIIRATRSPVRIADDGDLSWYEGDPSAARIPAEHVPNGRDRPIGLRLSDV